MNRRIRIALILAAWAALMVLALWARMRDPFDPAARAFGTNWPGDLTHVAVFGAAEVFLLLAIIRPWSYRRSWGRSALAALLFTVCGLFTLLVGMHAGTVLGIHGFWLLALGAAMTVTTLVTLLTPRSEAAA